MMSFGAGRARCLHVRTAYHFKHKHLFARRGKHTTMLSWLTIPGHVDAYLVGRQLHVQRAIIRCSAGVPVLRTAVATSDISPLPPLWGQLTLKQCARFIRAKTWSCMTSGKDRSLGSPNPTGSEHIKLQITAEHSKGWY